MPVRSPATSLALLFAPTLCVIAIRFGLPALEEIISEDYLLEISIHLLALSLGALMLYRYLRVEDHEFHRSRAIRRLSKTYKSEDRGLWDDKSDRALQKLEIKANTSNKRISAKVNKRMTGKIGSLNTEMDESEVEDGYEADVRVSGLQTIIDEENIELKEEQKKRNSISNIINSFLDRSARKRLLKMKRKEEKKKIKELHKTKKRASKNKLSGSPWEDITPSSNIRSVNKCNHCGAMNDGDSQYCISCGNYLLS
tara:strand:- start:460 stop:1224 length:765 start_codon:yes stop_codon:yes gene_type:complete